MDRHQWLVQTGTIVDFVIFSLVSTWWTLPTGKWLFTWDVVWYEHVFCMSFHSTVEISGHFHHIYALTLNFRCFTNKNIWFLEHKQVPQSNTPDLVLPVWMIWTIFSKEVFYTQVHNILWFTNKRYTHCIAHATTNQMYHTWWKWTINKRRLRVWNKLGSGRITSLFLIR